jgi:6-phospho-3-hexuloisomerase
MKYIKLILEEIDNALDKISGKQVNAFIDEIIRADRIVVVGAGRMGMMSKAFAMRLFHLGFSASFLGDSNIPNIGEDDLLIVASGSGETQTTYDLVRRGSIAKVCLITANPKSRIGKLADVIVKIKAPTKLKRIKTIQPMTTLMEQCVVIFFDAVVLELMKRVEETHKTMLERHSNLE